VTRNKFNKQVASELAEHPWISRAQAARLVKDHNRAKRKPVKLSGARRLRNVLRKALGLSKKKARK